MHFDRKLVRHFFLFIALMMSGVATAQAQSIQFTVRFEGRLDCYQPSWIKNVPISADFVGVLNPDGSASAQMKQTAARVLSSTVNFEGSLGGTPMSAPGGTSEIRVAGKRSLRLTWNLPNNQIITQITVAGQSCSASFESKLRPGQSQHTLYARSKFYYCDSPRIMKTTCRVASVTTGTAPQVGASDGGCYKELSNGTIIKVC